MIKARDKLDYILQKLRHLFQRFTEHKRRQTNQTKGRYNQCYE